MRRITVPPASAIAMTRANTTGEVTGFSRSPHDLVRADPIGVEQNDLTPPKVFPRGVAIFDENLKAPPISRRNGQGFFRADRADWRAPLSFSRLSIGHSPRDRERHGPGKKRISRDADFPR